MVLLKLLVFILAFNEFIVDVDATMICPIGHKVVTGRYKSHCEACSERQYQPEENPSQQCIPCTLCDTNSGSEVKQPCTKETNTKCQCRGEFVPWETDSSICKCDIGFGLKGLECLKCAEGYFSKKINSPCQKWKNLTNHRPHEGTQTLRMRTTITTPAPRQTTSKENEQPFHPANTGNHIGVTLLIFGIVGLLVLTAVSCKLHINPCWQKKRTVGLQTNGSMCGRPVEESGDGSQSSLKLNPGEP